MDTAPCSVSVCLNIHNNAGGTVQPLRVLVLDDEKRVTDELKEYLLRKKFQTYCANIPEEAFELLERTAIDILILDIKMPGMNGLDVLKKVKQEYPSMEVIMISGHGDIDIVIESMRLGATDFIRKPFGHFEVQLAIERTQKYIGIQNKLQQVENQKSLITRELETQIERDFIGTSRKIKKVLELAMMAAQDRDVNVLITGENGTGKEIIARIIHYASQRKDASFFPVNCSAIPESLLESEFFGHKKGSFTGATENKKGFFELASQGTLFLDEIADMPFLLQSKLLRAIEERKVKQVGSKRLIDVDIRIISATNKNILQRIEDSQFRIDLYHRINTFIINIPPLRERVEDIPPLVEHFVDYFSVKKNKPRPKIHPNVFSKLSGYHFPGNIRELKNMIERALIVCREPVLEERYFPIISNGSKNYGSAVPDTLILEDNERALIQKALEITNNNKTKASELLGITRYSLIRKMKKFEME